MTITFYSQFWQPGFGKSGIQSSNGQPSVSHNLINVGGQGSNPLFVEDDYMDVDDYALLQAQFDNADLPTGIEEPFTLLPEYDLGLKKTQNSKLQLNNSKIKDLKWVILVCKSKRITLIDFLEQKRLLIRRNQVHHITLGLTWVLRKDLAVAVHFIQVSLDIMHHCILRE
jgi:hypothetical protein